MTWVVDASVAVRWFLKEEANKNADEVLRRIVEQPDEFAVPELFTFEVYAVLQRLHPNGLQVYKQGVIPLLQAGIFRQPMTERLAIKANQFVKKGLTVYDACYAALAKDIKGLWLTFDEKAHRLIQEDNISLLLFENLPKEWAIPA
jgi:predicted nucleic acid-binding protein